MAVSTNPPKRLDPDSYRQLLSAAQTGSAPAIGELLESCRTYLLYIGERELSGELKIKVAPSDLVQETFAHGQRALADFRGTTPAQLKAWLRRILLNKAADARRRYLDAAARDLAREERQPNRSSIAAQVELLIHEETPSREAMRKERAAAVEQALARLPEHYQTVIRLRNFELLEFPEIAARMPGTDHSLRALWLRAIQRLKKELNGHDFA